MDLLMLINAYNGIDIISAIARLRKIPGFSDKS